MVDLQTEPPDYISWQQLAVMLKRRSRFIGSVASLAVLLTIVISLLEPRTYSTLGSFTPQQRGRTAPPLTGIASQLGIAVGSSDGQQSALFFSDLAVSGEILRRVVDTSYHLGLAGRVQPMTIADLLGISNESPTLRREQTVDRVSRMISATVMEKTGVVRIVVKSRWPELSEALATRVIAAVDSFNIRNGQSRGIEEARFSSERLVEARRRLRDAEDKYRIFLEQNRDIRGSPDLQFENNRLERTILAEQQIATSLQQAYEDARLDAVRNTPSIALVERPIVAVRPDSRGIVLRSAVACLLGLVLGTCVALSREIMVRVPSIPAEMS